MFAVLAALVLCSGTAFAQETTATPAPAPAPAATPIPAATPPRAMVESMKIVCDGKVKANGEAGFVFAADGAAPKDVRVTLQKGMSKSEVCRDIEKELAVMLGSGFKVEKYDDDKVKIDGKSGAKFSLTLGAQTATGVTFELK
jgi:hypothetical protein